MTPVRRQVVLAAGGLLPLLAGCAVPPAEQPMTRRFPPPGQVIVAPFTTLARSVQPDQGVASRLERAIENEPLGQAELREARAAQMVLQKALITHLQAIGLPAEPGLAEAARGPTLLVQGQIASLHEGNSTRRRLIGFGAGRSVVTADVQLLYLQDPVAPQFVEGFEATSRSPRTPGLAAPIGAGAAAGHAAVSAATGVAAQSLTAQRGSIAAELDQLAESITARVARLAESQGWRITRP